MAKAEQGNTAAGAGDHDRVVMLTLNPDGTPRQFNPEIIGDREVAVAAAKRQFAEQAVSARDAELRGVTAPAGGEGGAEPDPAVEPLVTAHKAAADAGEAAAEATVNSLHGGLGDPAAGDADAGGGEANPASAKRGTRASS